MAARTQRKTTPSRRRTASTRRRTSPQASRRTAQSRGGFAPRIAARPSDKANEIYMVGLRNAHAIEKEAMQVMKRQVDRIKNYPDVSKKLREHIRETDQQIDRLEQILEQHEESTSTVKDVISQMMGNTAAVAHSTAGDEILKNAFANLALEAYEIAAYKSLITMAMRQDDRKAVSLLKRSLAEEERMAKWVDANIAKVTLAYLDREEKGHQANR